ncbi:LCP family protein [Bacillus sp. ISL-55]|uniref:LCP family protein n=1 Tax=Bacillus sp. ISL-55 TaxID=2819134 RepID=UPI001BE630DA|nr:LCP family protein [Bacillus sp. ISL-55]MBT2693696.1 LCP family protein [Bacillus sp. ISL-55]
MSYNDRRSFKVERVRKKRRRIFYWIVLPTIVLLLSTASYGAFLYNKAQSVISDSYKPLDRDSKREKRVDPNIDNISILFVGVDDSETRKFSEGSRTDALMLATFNEKEKSVKLVSIPRDSYVHIPEKDVYTKINHAHSYGGVKLTIETVEEFLNIPVDYYVKLNFNAFIDVVDALNGIKVDVPYAFSEQDSEDNADAISLKAGYQKLDGEEALALARTRKLDNDIERGKRQQEIFKAIFKKAASASSITSYSNVIEAVGDNMTTNLTFSEMKSFTDYALALDNLNIETLNIAGKDAMIKGVYYYEPDEDSVEEIRSVLRNHLAIESYNNTNDNTLTKATDSDEFMSEDTN